MSAVGRAVGKIAGVVAVVASFIPGGQIVAAAAFAVSAATSIAFPPKKPPAMGSMSEIRIGANLPMPYSMGRTYVGGNLLHDVGYGPTTNDVPNPYRSLVSEYSGGGPIDSFEAFQADFTTITFSAGAATGYYSGFLWKDDQLGATPESSALAGPHGAIPDWGSAYKLSGHAASLITLKFDRKGKVYASGVPQFGVILKGVLAYDPRLDNDRPGGAGSHDFADESTFEWSDNPALHGITYARGRYQGTDDIRVVGCGFGEDRFDWPAWIAWANVCEANGWKVGGTLYEGAGINKWDNLKRICACGAAEPVFVGGLLSVRYSEPKTALDTITADDLAGDWSIAAMKSRRDRINGIVPRYRSEDHKWEYVQSELVSDPSHVTEDGEERTEERQYDLVQDKDQAAQLAAYELVDAREFGPIVLTVKPRLIAYRPGEALEVDIPELGLNGQLCIIRARVIDPATMAITLTLESETTAKHAYALGLTGTAPPTPTITSGEEMDEVISGGAVIERDVSVLINTSSPIGIAITATDTAITINNHTRRYTDKDVSVTGDTITTDVNSDPITATTTYLLAYDDEGREGGAVTWLAIPDSTSALAFTSPTYPFRHFGGFVTTDVLGGGGTTGGGATPPGGGGYGDVEE